MNKSELQYRALLAEELQAVQGLMLDTQLEIPPNLGLAISRIVNSGGKRLRPALVLLTSTLFDAELERARPVAAAVELLHTATLIHDDLIDQAEVRRGTETLNARWNPAATVLAGDMVFAWAAKMVTRGNNLHLVERFAETLETICGGELNQSARRGHIPTLEDYYTRIFAKTASLFALTTEAGPILAGASFDEKQAFRRFGTLLGLAFQIADDVLDFMSDEATLGKPTGSDLRQGLVTLPMLKFLECGTATGPLETVLADPTGNEVLIRALVEDLRGSDAADRAMQVAQGHIEEALDILRPYPASPQRAALEEIATYAVRRRY